MATPAPAPHRPTGYSFALVLADCIIAAVLAVLILLTNTSLSVIEALGWVFVVLGVYLASLLVP